jgi:hypothetical protein
MAALFGEGLHDGAVSPAACCQGVLNVPDVKIRYGAGVEFF